jgi:4-amino-4-deoxy-L-arabinose transferase-like glycosyltransferase
VAGNQSVAPFSGISDQIRYQTLAENLYQGNGFTYAGQPTALRAPLYPLLLVSAHILFGSYFLFAVRLFQFLAGISVACFCFLLAHRLFGVEAAAIAFALAIGLPTLVLSSIELQTENLATLLIVLFLYFCLREMEGQRWASAGLGLSSGLGMLIRFNCALLPIVGAAVCVSFRRSLKDAAVVCTIAAALLSPWIVRNLLVFRGSIIYSSHGGINLLEGILSPEGRAQKGESDQVRTAVGWLHTDLEVNDDHRLKFGSEDVLDKQARAAAILAWRNTSWESRIKLLANKLGWFWLSLDQFLETSSFSPAQQRLRAFGVITYWLVLISALVGILVLASFWRAAAIWIALYLSFVTVAHFPFVMNTRLRIPFVDPLLTVLAAGGIVFLFNKFSILLRPYESDRKMS